jgi:two-component system response regulator RegA
VNLDLTPGHDDLIAKETMTMPDTEARIAALTDRSLLLLDDDNAQRTRLGRALEARGFEVTLAASIAEALEALKTVVPAFAVLDMRLEDGTGLKIVEAVRERREDARIVMLTGYGAIATAVAAVKAGAVDYLQKPADADDVVKALLMTGEAPEPPDNPMSADRVRWEHIQRVYELCDHNVSETARRLGMHRRTLQRILAKRAPR